MENLEEEKLIESLKILLLSPDESNILLGKELAKGLNFNAVEWLYDQFGWLPKYSEEVMVGQYLIAKSLLFAQCEQIWIGDTISMFQQLEELYYSSSVAPEKSSWSVVISPNIAQLTQLKKLTLTGFKLRTIPESVLQIPNLEKLILSQNALQALPKYYELPPQLTQLNLDNCLITKGLDDSWKQLPVYCLMVGAGSFTIFIRGRKPLSVWLDFSPQFSIAQLIATFSDLEEVYLYRGWHLIDEIWDVLAQCKRLKYLELGLHYAPINPTHIPSKILDLEQLESLVLTNTYLTSFRNDLKTIARLPKLKSLKLTNIGERVNPVEWSDKWNHALLFFTQLESLSLHRLQLTEIPNTIQQLPKLKKLDIRHNDIKELPAWLKTMPNLKELDY